MEITGNAIKKAISAVGVKNAMPLDWNSKVKGFYVTIEDGVMTLMGLGDNIGKVAVGINVPNTDGFLDTTSARLFGLIGNSEITLSVANDCMIVTERTLRARSTTRIKIAI